MQIMDIKQNDISGFSKLAKRIVLESPYHSDFAKQEYFHDFEISKIKKDLKDKNTLLIAAKNEGVMVGFMRGFFDGGISTGIFWLQWIGVDAAYRRSDVANKMLNYLMKRLKTSYGAHKIVCVIRPPNEASIALFEKNKFQNLTLLKKQWYKEDFLLLYKFL